MHLACCGMDCDTCNASIANRTGDAELRAATAREWSELYNHPFRPEDIDCTGCRADGAKIGHCQVCAVRSCCVEKGLEHCGICAEYPCDTLEGFLKMIPPDDAAANLKRLESQR